MRILFLIAMLAAVGLVGWLWIESDSQPQRTVPTESASVIPDIQKLKELEDLFYQGIRRVLNLHLLCQELHELLRKLRKP